MRLLRKCSKAVLESNPDPTVTYDRTIRPFSMNGRVPVSYSVG